VIKLSRAPKPDFLDNAKVIELTDKFISERKAVWNIDVIKNPLIESSNKKCAYCECSLSTESNYMEVEHFEDKKHNPNKVVQWENLLPSCKRCNGTKSTHDVISEPIVNPFNEDPREHLMLKNYRLKGKSDKGKMTIQELRLNHSKRCVVSRFDIGEQIDKLIDLAQDKYQNYLTAPNTRSKNKLIGIMEGILQECQPTVQYSAITSINVVTDNEFISLVTALKEADLWNGELENLYVSAQDIALDLMPTKVT